MGHHIYVCTGYPFYSVQKQECDLHMAQPILIREMSLSMTYAPYLCTWVSPQDMKVMSNSIFSMSSVLSQLRSYRFSYAYVTSHGEPV
jgi:hypothetical protein